ncbi:MAG: M61 family metallopeptidase [Flavobacteriales bacterium]|jgi:predicted metalloprotease with PDZ domain
MVEYKVYHQNPHRKFITFEAVFPNNAKDTLQLQLPSWRPGRYELGNFAKNIRGLEAFNDKQEKLSVKKITKDLWEIAANGAAQVTINYEYYCAELNAGSSYIDNDLLYMNPVNCFFYDKEKQEQPYRVTLNLDHTYKVACGLKKESPLVLLANGFDELADAPILASPHLQCLEYSSHNIPFFIWISGKIKFNEEKIISDFKAFTDAHFQMFGDIPCSEYHFLFHFPPYFVRHGVEHHNSTVIAMGPATEFASGAGYIDLLAISCHELFHTWNIKNIRPIEMMPYDFTKENYSDLGYVAEGVTTYYGDLLLYRCGLLDENEWQGVLKEAIQEHLDNQGRFNISVAESSRDTWLDGYSAGIPWRKVSIYNEGCLVAYITDAFIQKSTANAKSLDDVMRLMYERFGKKQLGYTSNDYKKLIEEVAGQSADFIFEKLVYGTEDYLPYIIEALKHFGYVLMEQASSKASEHHFGFSLDENAGKPTVTYILENSPADQCGLWIGDEIVAINGQAPYKNVQSLMRQASVPVNLTIIRKHGIREIILNKKSENLLKKYLVVKASTT